MIKRILVLIVALVLLYGAAWLGAAFWLRARASALEADLTAQGYQIARSEPAFVGFPWYVGLKSAEMTVDAPAAHGGWRWHAAPIVFRLNVGAPTTPSIDLSGVQQITDLLSDAGAGLTLIVGRGTARFGFAADQSLDSFTLNLADTTVTGAASSEPHMSLGNVELGFAMRSGHISLRIDGLGLAAPMPALNATIREVELAIDVTGALPSGPLKPALEAWRDSGGAVEVRSFRLDWPPVRVTGSGTFALDTALQPEGAATLTLQGFADLIAALQSKGYVQESEAHLATTALGMLARPSATGEPELSLPVTIQERKLQAGPVTLMAMPEVIWSDKAKVP